ncbi:hypothetical protein IJS98_01195 [bacterium]|nr:hypothetical protein [bacterium]
MFRKIFYVLLVLALVAIAAFALWKNSGSEKEMQKLRAQMYDLQKQVEKQSLAKAEEEQSVKEEVKEEKEERKILSEALTAPSQTPPSVVRPASADTKSTLISVADSNDFAQSLADIQEEVKEQAMKETINEVAEAITNDTRAIDMSEVDAMIKEAEEKLVAQYGAQILEKEEKTAKAVETAEEVKEEVKVEEEKIVVSTPSWQDESALPGSVPVVNIDEFTTRKLDNAPTKIENNYISSRGEIKPVHGDAPIPPSQPSWTQNNEKAPKETVQRTTSLRPASEVIVPVTAKEEVEKDMKAEELRRRPPENVRRIPKKNYNALGKRTMADVMKEGL